MDFTIDQNEAKNLIVELIRIPSVNPGGKVAECAAFINQWLNENGIPSQIHEFNGVSNVVAKLGSSSGKRLLWNGHFDVVPPGENWDTDPFEGVYKDGFVYGRGTSDMKGGLAAMMLALKSLKDTPLNGEIVFMGIGDEETGSKNGTIALLRELGNSYDSAVVSEPTDFYLESAQRGLRWVEITVRGKACHAGRPYVGRNAVEYAAKAIAALKGIHYDVHHDIFEEGLKEPSLSITKISGGIQANVIPESCTLLIDRRLLPGETEEKILTEIRGALATIQEEGFSTEIKVVNKGWDPYIIDQNEAILNCLKKSYKDTMKEEPCVRGKGGCTDASHIFHAGIPVVIFGPGAAGESHTANEKVSVARIAAAAEIYVSSALDYFKL